jgi:O-antigen/teichoic acid export membrane protein
MKQNTYYTAFIKDNLIAIIGHLLVYLSSIILMPLIIKTVGVSIYGGYVLLSSIIGFIFGISSFGAGFRAKRFLPSTSSVDLKRLLFYPQFYFQLFSILFFSFLLIFMSPYLNSYILKNKIEYSPFLILLYLFCYFLYSQGSDYFRYTSRISYMMIGGLLFPYISIIFILLSFYLYDFININAIFLSYAFSALLIASFYFWIIFREIGIKLLFYNIKEMTSDIKLGFPITINFIVDFILASSDRYLIALYLNVISVGYYNPAYMLGSIIILIPRAIGTVLPQLLSKAVDKNNEYDAQKMLDYAIKIFLLLAIPFIFGSIILGKQILLILANQDVAENAYLIAPVVALGTLFYGLNIILSNVLFVRMKTYLMFKINLFASIFNLLANLILLYFLRNIIVPAITTFLSYLLAFLYINKIVKMERWNVNFQWGIILKAVVASLFMCGILFWLSLTEFHVSIVILIGKLFLGIFTYIIGLLVFGAISTKEIQFIKNYLQGLNIGVLK